MENGALVISLDFELYWGVRDKRSLDSYKKNLLGVRKSLPAMLKLFEKYQVHSTWATVGFLFAKNKTELTYHTPTHQPEYSNKNLSPYVAIEGLGEDEQEDPYHYASSLIDQIKQTPGQELATHTFCHYYCLERGQTEMQFASDIESAFNIAKENNVNLKSLVFPRNQFNQQYLKICEKQGLLTYRGNQKSYLYSARAGEQETKLRRALRLLDSYINLSGHHTNNIKPTDGILDIPASRFLRPYNNSLKQFETLKINRINQGLKRAAKKKSVFHLWWHPHNFGVNLSENLHNLEKILSYFKQLNDQYSFESLNMGEVYDRLNR